MVSAWWVLWAFLAGGYAGALLIGLMSMASRQDDKPRKAARIGNSHGEVVWRRRHGAPMYVGR